ncbi:MULTISPECIES: MarR family winged helix-turn-helix transcriptional regulator [Micromonospora]|uniref:MarR family transcriptional regulator n=1 Tax=Micromonospora maris TaxID=1003110 RepID=A0A9X0I060_9ACTN|nr:MULTISPECIES: MarR family winged helix-turn-helix transcriptional regulator [Micromonospora]AEB44870.1 transcriptional regulator, marr family protein [Micromonospora maris AB-18-032]KUJ44332.1 MarR family transcriptional regulator [Micromonospora maris]RUL92181.1 MarR family transcriptional regulator [Verrucosispora sp. FIM060022]
MTEPTTGGVNDDESLAETFRAVAARLRRQTREALEPWAVTPSQSRALGVLARLGEARPGTLAEHLRIAPRSATEVIDDLQERGFVARRPDPADRRATLVALTEEGHRVGTEIRAARRAAADRFFGHLDDADRAELTRILRTLRT